MYAMHSQDCKKRNCVYETSFLTCKERQEKAIEEKFGSLGKKRVNEEK